MEFGKAKPFTGMDIASNKVFKRSEFKKSKAILDFVSDFNDRKIDWKQKIVTQLKIGLSIGCKDVLSL